LGILFDHELIAAAIEGLSSSRFVRMKSWLAASSTNRCLKGSSCVNSRPDYWDFATQLEIAMLAKDEAGAMEALSKAVAVVREGWEPETIKVCPSTAG
jgi:MAP3K TRAFs-binding domain